MVVGINAHMELFNQTTEWLLIRIEERNAYILVAILQEVSPVLTYGDSIE